MDTVKTPKHTPGPWNVEHIPGIDMGATAEITAPCEDGGTPFDGRSIIVAQVWKTNDETRWSDDETAQANARLMAAAPDLLAACNAALAYLDAEDSAGLVAEIAAAVARAEGRTETSMELDD